MRRLSFLSHIHLLCCRLIDHRYLGLFLGSPFCSINYVFFICFFFVVVVFCFGASIMLFLLLWFYSIVWSLGGFLISLFFFSKACFDNSGSFVVLYKFRIICSSSMKNTLDILIRIGKGAHQVCILSPAYLNYMQRTSCKMPGWMNHKLESRFPGEISISITSDMQKHCRKRGGTEEPLDDSERGVKKLA